MIDINKAKHVKISKKQINFRIDRNLFNELNEYCKKNKIIKSRLLEEAIKEIIKKDKKWQ